jgi:hypothetical protein
MPAPARPRPATSKSGLQSRQHFFRASLKAVQREKSQHALANSSLFLCSLPGLAGRRNGLPAIFCLAYFILMIYTGHIMSGSFSFIFFRTFPHFCAVFSLAGPFYRVFVVCRDSLHFRVAGCGGVQRFPPQPRILGRRTVGIGTSALCCVHTQEFWHNCGRERKCSIGCIGCIGYFGLPGCPGTPGAARARAVSRAACRRTEQLTTQR